MAAAAPAGDERPMLGTLILSAEAWPRYLIEAEESGDEVGLSDESSFHLRLPLLDPTSSSDWRHLFPRAFNQGRCGCCYVAAPVYCIAAVRVQAGLANQPEALSVQYVLDRLGRCCGKWKRFKRVVFKVGASDLKHSRGGGCGGGEVSFCFDFLQEKGVCYDHEYSPFQAADKTCDAIQAEKGKFRGKTKVKIKSYVKEVGVSAERLISHVLKQPVVVPIALSDDFNDFVLPDGSLALNRGLPFSPRVNHAVVLAGYDPARGFLVFNSHGEGCGDHGCFWIPRDFLNASRMRVFCIIPQL